MKLRATVVVDYEANPRDYETYDAAEAAAIDQKNWRKSPAMFFLCFPDDRDLGKVQITVEPLELKRVTA